MRRPFFALFALAALLASGCSLLTRFDDGTQLCDDQAPVGDQCLAGFSCVGGHCVSGDGGSVSTDAGNSSGDAGSGDGGH